MRSAPEEIEGRALRRINGSPSCEPQTPSPSPSVLRGSGRGEGACQADVRTRSALAVDAQRTHAPHPTLSHGEPRERGRERRYRRSDASKCERMPELCPNAPPTRVLERRTHRARTAAIRFTQVYPSWRQFTFVRFLEKRTHRPRIRKRFTFSSYRGRVTHAGFVVGRSILDVFSRVEIARPRGLPRRGGRVWIGAIG